MRCLSSGSRQGHVRACPLDYPHLMPEGANNPGDKEVFFMRAKHHLYSGIEKNGKEILMTDMQKQHISGEGTALAPQIVPLPDIAALPPKDARAYAYLDLEVDGELRQRIAITDTCVTVGRIDTQRGIMPEIDLTFLDPLSSVSREH